MLTLYKKICSYFKNNHRKNKPKVRLASKFERRVDQRTFTEKHVLFDGVSFRFTNRPSPPTNSIQPSSPITIEFSSKNKTMR